MNAPAMSDCPIARLARPATGLWILLLVVPAAVAQPGTDASAASAATAESALELYDGGRYVEARRVLEQLDERGELDGPLLYRFYYCQRVSDDARAQQTLERAIERLEADAPAATSLEVPFYLANAYSNANRPDDQRRAAADLTRRVESGALPAPTNGMDQFRLGKLYADQGRDADAEKWFADAVESFSGEDQETVRAYVSWAARYLADASFRRDDLARAETYLTRALETGQPNMADLDRLAVIRCRLGLFAEAARAWRQAELLNPAQANRARYAYRLAEAAAKLEGLGVVAPDGRLWTELSKPDLEKILEEQVAAVRSVKQENQDAGRLGAAERAGLQARLDAARVLFVGAALEYVLQGNSLREAAFFGGYAPLVFKDTEWQLPRPPNPTPSPR